MMYSVLCFDSHTPESRADWERVAAAYPAPLSEIRYFLAPCGDLHPARASADKRELIRSPIPTLIITARRWRAGEGVAPPGVDAKSASEGSAHLESLGERILRADGRGRTIRLFAVHGLDLFPVYVWLDEDGTTFADDWTIREQELALYVEAGIPAPEVLALATLGAARIMGMDDELGSIEPGKLADFILVDGDPVTDIHDLRRVVLVVKDGRVYDSAAIYRALELEP